MGRGGKSPGLIRRSLGEAPAPRLRRRRQRRIEREKQQRRRTQRQTPRSKEQVDRRKEVMATKEADAGCSQWRLGPTVGLLREPAPSRPLGAAPPSSPQPSPHHRTGPAPPLPSPAQLKPWAHLSSQPSLPLFSPTAPSSYVGLQLGITA